MNHVGPAGRGESVWLGWFLQTVLPQFADLAESLSDGDRAGRYRAEAERLWQALEATAWDGAWYRRAYFDDGTPLGSAQNPACRIDSLPQTWAVICGRADPDRAARAMRAVEEQLVDEKAGLIRLFTPPFDGGPMEPGYIKGYLPGVRENGGQYTHGAAWVVLATALSGRGTRAVELFNLLNPIRHALTPEAAECYKVEPYVMAGDVYADGPHLGRGGWTWYTGAAGWTYRVALETILGLHRRGDRLRIEPTIPADWPRFTITYRFGKSTYRIEVENPNKVEHGVKRVTVDGEAVESGDIELRDDGRTHEVRVEM
jgi:cyclic beta-1,2-glucan synthetase